MSSISNFLNTAMTIDQQEGSAEDNYNYEKEQLGAMYDETKQNLIDSAAQALPFGIAETSRAVAGLWQTGKAIQNFSAKYSPAIAEFKAKAATMYENIGKEGAVPTDYADLIKSASSSIGKKALELAAPEVMKRTGIDLKQAVTASKGEGGVEAGLENLRSQGVNIVKTKAAGMVEAGVSRVRAAVAPVVDAATGAVERAGTFAKTGAEHLTDIFEQGASDMTTHVSKLQNIATTSTDEVARATASKALGLHEEFQVGKAKLQSSYESQRAALETQHAELSSKVDAAEQRVKTLQEGKGAESAALTDAVEPMREVAGGNAMYGRGRSGVLPGERRPAIEMKPVTEFKSSQLATARQELAGHTEALNAVADKATALESTTKEGLTALQAGTGEGLATLKSTAQTAMGVAKGVGGAALEVMGVVGAEESIRSIVTAGGRVGGEQGTNDAGGIYGGIRSAQALGSKGISAARQALGLGEKAGEKVAETGGEKVAESGGIKVGSAATRQLASGAIKEGGTAAVEGGLEATAETVGKDAAIKVGTSLAAEGAELGAAAAVGSAIPIVGEALDIGLGLYTVIDSFINLFKKPPAPPPPPPVQQQIVAVQHQQGVY